MLRKITLEFTTEIDVDYCDNICDEVFEKSNAECAYCIAQNYIEGTALFEDIQITKVEEV